MRGLHTSLVIVVAAIVILIVALIILTIFGVGITPISSLTDAKSYCLTQGAYTCQATGNPPIGWNSPSVKVEGQGLVSCETASNGLKTCEEILGGGNSGSDGGAGETKSGVLEIR